MHGSTLLIAVKVINEKKFFCNQAKGDFQQVSLLGSQSVERFLQAAAATGRLPIGHLALTVYSQDEWEVNQLYYYYHTNCGRETTIQESCLCQQRMYLCIQEQVHNIIYVKPPQGGKRKLITRLKTITSEDVVLRRVPLFLPNIAHPPIHIYTIIT